MRVLTGQDRRRPKRRGEGREEGGKRMTMMVGGLEESAGLQMERRNRGDGTICAFPI